MERSPCPECGAPIPPRRRKYCSARCGRRLWNRELRRRARELRRRSRGIPPHLDFWLSKTADEATARAAYNAYMADYMRRRRQLQRNTVGLGDR